MPDFAPLISISGRDGFTPDALPPFAEALPAQVDPARFAPNGTQDDLSAWYAATSVVAAITTPEIMAALEAEQPVIILRPPLILPVWTEAYAMSGDLLAQAARAEVSIVLPPRPLHIPAWIDLMFYEAIFPSIIPTDYLEGDYVTLYELVGDYVTTYELEGDYSTTVELEGDWIDP